MLLNVVVVDDNSDILQMLELVLESYKFDDIELSVISYTSPLTALEKMKTEIPDILISDVCMDGMDGLSMLRMLRKRGVMCPAILASDYYVKQETIQRAVPQNHIVGILDKGEENFFENLKNAIIRATKSLVILK